MRVLLEIIKNSLATIRKERLASEGCKAQHYWRGYRDALQLMKQEIQDMIQEGKP